MHALLKVSLTHTLTPHVASLSLAYAVEEWETYCIAGYSGGNSGLLEKGRKLQLADINVAVTGARGTGTTPSLGVYALVADLMLAV